ncbi:MAG: hypothetical protein HYS23_04155 [Geobacter sp.]|nr:hypothetical protein [Geobacter sp.]
MTIDQGKLRELIARPVKPAAGDELRRDGNVFFVGGALPAQETLETLFDSHCQAPAELFHITFGDKDSFHKGEELARLIKKNFHAHLMARLDWPAPTHFLERAYAAGVDIVDIPLMVFDSAISRERALRKEERLAALEKAKEIFPRWSVTSTLLVGEEACCSTVSAIDLLLKSGIVPLPEISPRAGSYPRQEIGEVFLHLAEGLCKRKVTTIPLLPLLSLTTPLVEARQSGILKGFIDRLQDRRLLAASDLRRSLRVKQIEESFESAGL